MKKLLLIAAVLGFTTWSYNASAQDDKGEKGPKGDKDKKESQEIIIRKKGDKDTKITVEISGDKVTINGKPLSEFKDDEITINRRNIIVRDGKGNNRYSITTPDMFDGFSGFWSDDHATSNAFLGVTTQDVEGGAKITDVTEESAAAKAGLKEGDIITKIADKKVEGQESLYDIISSMKPKDDVTIYYKRDGKENSAKAVLGERKGGSAMAYSFSGPDGLARTYTMPRTPRIQSVPKMEMWDNDGFNYSFPRQKKLGLRIQDTEDGNGVKVLGTDTDSPAEKAGLKKDDIVTEIGGKRVSNTDEAREQLMDAQEKPAYTIKAKRNGSEMSFDIKIPKKLKTANL
jgi:serine protease Do